MSREANAGVVLGLLVVGALIMLTLRSTSTETGVLSPVTLGDPQDVEPAAAVITEKHESGGFSILSLRFGHTTYRLRVQFYDAPGCYEVVSFGEPWPTPFEACSSSVSITGEISAIGVTATGESIIGVDIEVPKDCYQAVARGEMWPPAAPACTDVLDR